MRLLRTAARVTQTRYPRFALGLPLARDEIPVFIYHDVAPEELAADLEFLRDNGYRTLGLAEYLRARERGERTGRSVLLTFDDARRSFWQIALPQLRTFDARAVLFAPTYWLSSGDAFMTWQQARECAASGLVDVQSHAHRHALVAVSETVIDFAHPAALERFDIYDWPMRAGSGGDELGWPALGTPVHRAEPLLSARRRYCESEAVTRACIDLVAENGGPEFFATADWRKRLLGVHRARARTAPGRFLEPAAFRALLESEFEASRDRFREHLGYAPTAFAFPWRLGSPLSLALARRFGIHAVFGVAVDFGAERRRHRLPLPVYGRLKCDWVQSLPGKGRRGLRASLGRKCSGLHRAHHLAH